MADAVLQGLKILVTRPLAQAHDLKIAIEALCGQVILLPTLEIVTVIDEISFDQIQQPLIRADIAIFTSVNAVQHTQVLLKKHQIRLSQTAQIIAIGAATANALTQAGYTTIIKPNQLFTSEALLNLPALQQVAGRRVIIFKGIGGRDLLAQALRERDAVVNEISVYRRVKPQHLQFDWQNNSVDIIIVTSAESLENLYYALDDAGQTWLQNTPMLVVSERLAQLAKKLSISTVYIAASASTAALIEALKEYRHVKHHR